MSSNWTLVREQFGQGIDSLKVSVAPRDAITTICLIVQYSERLVCSKCCLFADLVELVAILAECSQFWLDCSAY